MRKTIIFIIDGEDVLVEVDNNEHLYIARHKALIDSLNWSRPANDWDIRSESGVLLDPGSTVDGPEFANNVRLFLTLQVGVGGADIGRVWWCNPFQSRCITCQRNIDCVAYRNISKGWIAFTRRNTLLLEPIEQVDAALRAIGGDPEAIGRRGVELVNNCKQETSMKLIDLEPSFKKVVDERTMRNVDTLAEAEGIKFLCPYCFRKNNGAVGTHSIIIWFEGRGAPPEWEPLPRWRVSGTGYGDLTITPSILDSECWHGYVTKGEISFCQ
jgi:hypothetical protein